MKRIYLCLCIVAALFGIAYYSSFRVQSFTQSVSADLDSAVEAIRAGDYAAARIRLASAADLCDEMREGIYHLLPTGDFTTLDADLRAADGHLEQSAPEEAMGEVRRAQVELETMAWLARRVL